MSAKPPPAVCTECGCIVDHAVDLEYWQDAVTDAALQRRYRKALQAERDKLPKAHSRYDDAMKVLKYWRDTCMPGAKELEGERLILCLARLDSGFSVDELKRAVYGYSLKPYVVNGRRTHQGPRDTRRVDATLIFRDEQHVGWGLQIAARADELTGAFSTNGGPPEPPPGRLSVLGEAALRVARAFPVFPVKPREKLPLTRHGLKDAKQDEAAIRTFWTRVPDANIGVPTGKVSGFIVLDVDGDSGYESLTELEDKYEVLPDTKSVKTPRGGSHLFFQHPGDREIHNSASLLGPALDVRGDGGYVLVPPSVGPTGKYVTDEEAPMMPMPAWLLELIEERQTYITEALRSGELEVFFKAGATEGNRNDRLFRYACSIVRDLRPDRAAFVVHGMNRAYVEPPLPDREVDQVIRSALRYQERKT